MISSNGGIVAKFFGLTICAHPISAKTIKFAAYRSRVKEMLKRKSVINIVEIDIFALIGFMGVGVIFLKKKMRDV